MTKRVLFINHVSEILGGAELSLISLAENLEKHHGVTPFFLLPEKKNLAEEIAKKNWEVITTKFSSFDSFLHIPYFFMTRRIAHIAYKYQIDLLHGNSLPCFEFIGLAGNFAKIKSVCHIRDIPPDWLLKAKRYKMFSDKIDRIIAISNGVAEKMLKNPYSTNKVRVVHNGINTKKLLDFQAEKSYRKELNIAEDVFLIGMASRIHPDKDHETALKTFKILIDNGTKVHLAISGDDRTISTENYLEKIKSMTRDLGLENHVSFCGQVNDIYSFMKSLDLLLLGSKAEPFGRVIIEAMALGTPVLASSGGGVPEIITDNENGILVNPEDPENWSQKILWLLNNKSVLDTISKNGLSTAKDRFDIENTALNVMNVYNEINN